jgi:hypothetical protein
VSIAVSSEQKEVMKFFRNPASEENFGSLAIGFLVILSEAKDLVIFLLLRFFSRLRLPQNDKQ